MLLGRTWDELPRWRYFMKTFLTKRKKYELSSYFFFHPHLTPPNTNCQIKKSGALIPQISSDVLQRLFHRLEDIYHVGQGSDFFKGDFFRSDFFGGDSKGGSHPRTHHSNFNHIPLNDIHIAIRFHTIPHTTTTTPHTHIHLHTHLHAHIHTYAYTHTGQPGNVDKKAYNHTQDKKQKVNGQKSACSRACTHARVKHPFF